ncbi:Uncharacterised protein [Klebsiella pneumoniae]|nr:Uncharacterised protein [Klebsiella pneumoniae]
MSPAAQLRGEVAHPQNAHAIVVFLAKQRHGAGCARGIDIHNVGFDSQVTTDLRVDQVFHRTNFFRLHRFKMREVKAQRFIIDQRTFLRHMGAEHLAQRRVHQVRRGVVETDTLTASLIYVGLHRVTHFQ